MQKRDCETYQKRFRDFEILQKFSETHVFRGTIRHPYKGADVQMRPVDVYAWLINSLQNSEWCFKVVQYILI